MMRGKALIIAWMLFITFQPGASRAELGQIDEVDQIEQAKDKLANNIRELQRQRDEKYKIYAPLAARKEKYQNLENYVEETREHFKDSLGDLKDGLFEKDVAKRAAVAIQMAAKYIRLKKEEMKYVDEIRNPTDLSPLEDEISRIEKQIEQSNNDISKLDKKVVDIKQERWNIQVGSLLFAVVMRGALLQAEKQRIENVRKGREVEHRTLVEGYNELQNQRAERERQGRAIDEMRRTLRQQMNQAQRNAPAVPTAGIPAPPPADPAPPAGANEIQEPVIENQAPPENPPPVNNQPPVDNQQGPVENILR